jgi:LEA14-like dessication related protein
MRKLALLLPLLVSCSLLQSVASAAFERPSLAFRDVKLEHIDFTGADVNLLFDVTNPNSSGLDLGAASYALAIEGHPVATGTPPKGLQVPGKGTSTVTLPAHVTWDQLAPALEAVLSKKTLAYKASGTIGVNSPIGLINLPLEHEGVIEPPHLPSVSLQPPRIVSLHFTGARLALPLKLTNTNAFPLPLGGVDGTVDIEGARVGRVALAQLPAVGASSEQTIELPLDISFVSAGLAVASALKAGAAHIKLDGTLRSLGASLPLHIDQNVQFSQSGVQ